MTAKLDYTNMSETSPLASNTNNISLYSSSSDSASIVSTSSKDRDNNEEFIPPLSYEQAILPDITLRGILLGLTIGSLLSFTNMYFGLQTGWISMMSLQASLIGYAIAKSLAWYGKNYPLNLEIESQSTINDYKWYDLTIPFGIKENVFIQTCAVATATMPLAGGFVGIIPALGMLSPEDRPNHGISSGLVLNTYQLLLWGLGIAFFGVFFAVPLRKQVILKEKLKFPSGTATAQMIQLLHKPIEKNLEEDELSQDTIYEQIENKDEESNNNSNTSLPFSNETAQQWKALLATFSLSSITTLLTTLYPEYSIWPIFNIINSDAVKWNWYITPALSYMGQGIIMGLPTTLSMLLGSIIGWGILSPISFYMGWAKGEVNDWKDGARGWILWISLAVMISESIVSLSLITFKEIKTQYSNYINGRNQQDIYEKEVIPSWALYSGLFLSTVGCIMSISIVFDEIPLYSIIISLFLGCVLSILAVRALGETDLNPVSGIGKVSQVVFGALLPGNLVGNLVAGGVAEAGAMQAGDMMQDLKTGHLLNASPRAQFYGQLLGSLVSVFISVFAYQLFTSTYTIPGPEFQVPTAQIWLDMAKLVNGHPLPPYSATFSIVFAIIFTIIPIVKFLYSNTRLVQYLPSGIAFAIGIYNPPNFTLPRVLGALICEAYLKGWFTSYLISPIKQLIEKYKARRSPDMVPCQIYNQRRASFYPSIKEEQYSSNFHKVLFTVIASGLVLGEGTMAVSILIAKVFTK
ncbi:OPT superfamily oligopeptide transporter [Neoconidiobolus thromboides FSU 785]|nr:OPT superfamily oligopeptide transporter [Neoconidiobolus thromboides FSU 785]